MSFSPSEFGPLAFILFFVACWLAMGALLSLFSGWSSLARHFRANGPSDGDRFRFASGSLGRRFLPVNYSNCLFVTVSDEGLYISLFFPFRFCSPPLFIPWTMVESAVERRVLFARYVQMRIRDHWPILSIHGRARRLILERYQARLSPRPKSPRWQIGDRRPN